MYEEKKVKKSELLQLLLLDSLYAQSGSEDILFQGGTALRWMYGGMRFSEDLDFVTHLPQKDIHRVLDKTFRKTHQACIAQFGNGQFELKNKKGRKEAHKVFYIFRPAGHRGRIAVKLEFETLKTGYTPDFKQQILSDVPSVAGMVTTGQLILPYTSSIILTETPAEILTDKIRALYERSYLKGRDIYDLWWIITKLDVGPIWSATRKKFHMYQAPFTAARQADYFQKKASVPEIIAAIKRDLPRFIPQNIYAIYEKEAFRTFIEVLNEVTLFLLTQGMNEYLKAHASRKINP